MSMFRAIRDELFKYRKHKRGPIDGAVPGVPYADYRRSRHYVSGLPHGPKGPSHHDLYNWGVPREYHPDISAPAVQSEEYTPNENWESHMIAHPTDPRLLRPFPDSSVPEEKISWERSGAASEFFLKVMEVMYRPLEDGQTLPSLADIWREHFRDDQQNMADMHEPVTEIPTETAAEVTPEDLMRRFINITGALGHLQTVFPEDHPDITNLRGALHEILDDPEAMSKLESLAGETGPSKLGTGDPYATDAFEEAEQLYEQQMQSIENALDEPMLDPAEHAAPQIFDEQSDMMFEQLPEEAFPEGLEQIVEQEDPFTVVPAAFMEQDMMLGEMVADVGMAGAMADPGYDAGLMADEINQAIDQVTQQAMPQEEEPDPFGPMHAPYMMGPFDQMQYMVDPFAMPGPYGPMGPNPMGPTPGP